MNDFWIGFGVMFLVLCACWLGLVVLFAYFDRTATYPRKTNQ